VAVRSPGVSRTGIMLSRGPEYRWSMVYKPQSNMAIEARGALRHTTMVAGPVGEFQRRTCHSPDGKAESHVRPDETDHGTRAIRRH
jgi:hypothetical protein